MTVDMSAFKRKGRKTGALNKCRICYRRIQTFEAANENNTKHAHLHCALKRGVTNQKWKVFFGLKAEERLRLYRFVDEDNIMDHIETLALNLRRANKKVGFTQDPELPPGLKRRKNKGYIKRGRTNRKSPEVSKFLHELLQQAKSTVDRNFNRSSRNSFDKDQLEIREIPSTGGRITLLDTTDLTREEQDFVQTREGEGLREIEGLTPFDTVASIVADLYKVIEPSILMLNPSRNSRLRTEI